MTKKSKKVHLPTSSHDSAGEEQDLSGNERGCWYPHDTDSFHWVLSRYTKIAPDSILLLDHRYLDIRDISLVEQIESENEASKGTVGFKPVTDNEIIHRLELANDSNPNKDCKRWYTLLKDLQAAAGGKHSVRQINTKHINTRSRWSVPFKSLHEVGYLIKNQTQRGAKNRTSNQNTQVHTHRTNIEKKNLASIKALKKYMYHRQHVELYYPEKSYLNFTFAEPLVDSDNVDDVSEPERWIRAMIKRHGPPMVLYMDTCAQNLANSYISELNARLSPTSRPHSPLTGPACSATICKYLDQLIEEVMAIPKQARSTTPKTKAPLQPHIQPVQSNSAYLSPAPAPSQYPSTNKSKGVQKREREQSAAPEPENSGRPVQAEPMPIGANSSKYAATHYNASGDGESEIKRSKSHLFTLGAAQTSKQDDLPSSFGVNSLGSYNHYQSSEGAPAASAPSTNQHLPDDDFFTSFINFDPSSGMGSISDQNYRYALSPSYNGDSAPPPPDLLDAIVNLTVNSRSSASLADAGYNDSLLMQRIASPTPLNNAQSMVLPSHSFSGMEYPAPLPRAITDPNTQSRALSPTHAEQHSKAPSDLNSLFANSDMSFNFQMPYDWQNSNASVAQADSNVVQPRILIPHSQSQSHSFNEHHHPHHHSNSFGEQPFSLPRHHITPQQPPEPNNSANTLSTRLIYVNGQPSHIELTHDNSGVNPNPIILPISSVLNEHK